MRRKAHFFILIWVMVSWACHDKIIVYPPQPIPETSSPRTVPEPPTDAISVKIVPIEPKKEIKPTLSRFEIGMTHFRQGNYPEAILDFKIVLQHNPQPNWKVEALYFLGLSYALSPGSRQNLSEAKTSLNQIVKEFPQSDYRSPAELILRLMERLDQLNLSVSERDKSIQKLREELDRLKEIDLKRRPSFPKEQ